MHISLRNSRIATSGIAVVHGKKGVQTSHIQFLTAAKIRLNNMMGKKQPLSLLNHIIALIVVSPAYAVCRMLVILDNVSR